MRILPSMLTIFVLTAGIDTRANAQNYPWCEYLGTPGGRNCGFVSFNQCMETARGTGGDCRQNTQYVSPRRALGAANPQALVIVQWVALR
jgi:Protein of unknown function (DUF3551)